MSKALYQKYRPQKFSEVLGHDLIKKVLLNSLKAESLSHAILLAGPRGTGKTSMARLLAKALNCKDPGEDGDCCGVCSVCTQVEKGSYIDLIEIDAASNRGIEEIRILKEKVNFSPAEGKYKIYIIDEVHMLTKEAFNALLKTLEEPPEFVIFVLATTEPHKIPMTILSRVQRFDLKLAKEEELISKLQKIADLEGIKIEKNAIAKIFELSGGSYRDSESLFSKLLNSEIKTDKEISLSDVEEAFGLINDAAIGKFCGFLLEGNSQKAFDFSQKLLDEGFSVDQIISQTIGYFRSLIRQVMEGKVKANLGRIVLILSKFSSAGAELRNAQIMSLPLEIAILELGSSENTIAPDSTKYSRNVASVNSAGNAKGEGNPGGTVVEMKKEDSEKNDAKVVQKVKKKEETSNAEAKETVSKVVQKSSQTNDTTKLSFEVLNADWKALIDATKEHNHHLYAFLSKAELDAFDGEFVGVRVPYKFHKQKIESLGTREIISKIFMDKYGIKVIVKCEVDPTLIEKIEDEEGQEDSNENIVEEVFNDL